MQEGVAAAVAQIDETIALVRAVPFHDRDDLGRGVQSLQFDGVEVLGIDGDVHLGNILTETCRKACGA